MGALLFQTDSKAPVGQKWAEILEGLEEEETQYDDKATARPEMLIKRGGWLRS